MLSLYTLASWPTHDERQTVTWANIEKVRSMEFYKFPKFDLNVTILEITRFFTRPQLKPIYDNHEAALA